MAAVDEFVAADYVEHPRPSTLPPGTEGMKQLIGTYRTAFPDLKMTLDDILAEGEMVAFRWSVSGTHLGDWLGVPPTGNHVAATGITLLRVAFGKVVEGWTSIDLSPAEEELRWSTQDGGGQGAATFPWPSTIPPPKTGRSSPATSLGASGLRRSGSGNASSRNCASLVRSGGRSCPRRPPCSKDGT